MARARKKHSERKTIGRVDKIDLPDLDVWDITAKVDTGAFTCSIHCAEIQEIEKDGKRWISFLIPESEQLDSFKRYQSDRFTQRLVKSSSGHTENRYVIKTTLRLFGEDLTAEFTLSDRSSMRYPLLLGRKVLQGRFVVDVAKTNQSYKTKKNTAHAPSRTLKKP